MGELTHAGLTHAWLNSH